MIDLALAILFFPAYLLYGPVEPNDPEKSSKLIRGWLTSAVFWWLAWVFLLRRWF